MIELKPCPFCGSGAHVAEVQAGGGHVLYSVCCDDMDGCIAGDPMRLYRSQAQAIEAWNRRAE